MKRSTTSKSTAMVVLSNYFGMQEGQNRKGFLMEVRELSNEDRLELAQGAAREMGLSESEVVFDLA